MKFYNAIAIYFIATDAYSHAVFALSNCGTVTEERNAKWYVFRVGVSFKYW
jgi:hypothetical protein